MTIHQQVISLLVKWCSIHFFLLKWCCSWRRIAGIGSFFYPMQIEAQLNTRINHNNSISGITLFFRSFVFISVTAGTNLPTFSNHTVRVVYKVIEFKLRWLRCTARNVRVDENNKKQNQRSEAECDLQRIFCTHNVRMLINFVYKNALCVNWCSSFPFPYFVFVVDQLFLWPLLLLSVCSLAVTLTPPICWGNKTNKQKTKTPREHTQNKIKIKCNLNKCTLYRTQTSALCFGKLIPKTHTLLDTWPSGIVMVFLWISSSNYCSGIWKVAEIVQHSEAFR